MQRGPKLGFSTQQGKLFSAMKERHIGRTYTGFQRIRTKELEEKERKDKRLCCVNGGEKRRKMKKKKAEDKSEEGKGISTESSVKLVNWQPNANAGRYTQLTRPEPSKFEMPTSNHCIHQPSRLNQASFSVQSNSFHQSSILISDNNN
ncbi:hypothetical protein VNO80_17506 [Phaseolus coccineus]|uniref:Uncharacterized protein n=1 Tax=Phaseolus coccineus TaxID=3886 RepID=A0AAN9MFW3_PHACN